MKSKLFLLTTLVLVSFHVWAGNVDSLSTKLSSRDYIDKSKGYERIDYGSNDNGIEGKDGIFHKDSLYLTTDLVSSIITPGSTAVASSTSTSSSSSQNVPVGSYKTYTCTVTTFSNQEPAKLTDNNSGMFSLEKTKIGEWTKSYTICVGGVLPFQVVFKTYFKWKVTVTYKPTSPGTHTAKLKLYQNDFYLGSFRTTTTTKQLRETAINPPASVTVSKTSLHFDKADTKSFKVTGYNLSGSLTLRKRGLGQNYFTVTPTTISKTNATNGTWVNVTCNPTNSLQHTTAYVDIIHNGKVLKTITLTYAKNQPVQISMIEPKIEPEGNNEESSCETSIQSNGNAITSLDELTMNSRVHAEGMNIVIESPEEQNALISDLAGRASSVSLQVGRNEIPVNASGIYIVRIREKTTKLIIK